MRKKSGGCYLGSMKLRLLILLLIAPLFSLAQEVNLRIIKNGKVKKKIPNGTYLVIVDKNRDKYVGPFYIVNDSMLSVGESFIPINSVVSIKFQKPPKNPFNWGQFGLVTLGVGLSTAGMAGAGWETPKNAIINSTVIGYSPYIIDAAKRAIFKKKRKWKVRRNTWFRIWDMRMEPRGF